MVLGVPILKHFREKRLVVYNYKYIARRAITNVVRTCGPTHLLLFDFMSNKICLNQTNYKYINVCCRPLQIYPFERL